VSSPARRAYPWDTRFLDHRRLHHSAKRMRVSEMRDGLRIRGPTNCVSFSAGCSPACKNVDYRILAALSSIDVVVETVHAQALDVWPARHAYQKPHAYVLLFSTRGVQERIASVATALISFVWKNQAFYVREWLCASNPFLHPPCIS
jgi:hypothetical protein